MRTARALRDTKSTILSRSVCVYYVCVCVYAHTYAYICMHVSVCVLCEKTRAITSAITRDNEERHIEPISTNPNRATNHHHRCHHRRDFNHVCCFSHWKSTKNNALLPSLINRSLRNPYVHEQQNNRSPAYNLPKTSSQNQSINTVRYRSHHQNASLADFKQNRIVHFPPSLPSHPSLMDDINNFMRICTRQRLWLESFVGFLCLSPTTIYHRYQKRLAKPFMVPTITAPLNTGGQKIWALNRHWKRIFKFLSLS